jgi:replicative DNA helicase
MIPEPSFQPLSDSNPPQNVEAEEAILGAILLDPEAIGRVADSLQADAFYISAHREVYRAALGLQAQGKPTDLTTISASLQDNGKLDGIGGQSRLAQLIDRVISTANVDQYAELVMDKYLRRKLIKAGNEVIQLGYDTTTPLEKVLDQSEQKVFGITQDRPQGIGLTPTSDILTTTFNEIESRSLGTALSGIPCNFYDLDGMTQGFQRSDLIIVAARPAMGKCLAANSEIVLADGSVRTIEQIYLTKDAQLLTLGNDYKFRSTQPSNYVDDGIKPLFRVTTRLGRQIETTLTHPYLTIQGWRPLGELQVGDRVGVPRRIPISGSKEIPESEIYQLVDSLSRDNYREAIPEIVFTLKNPQVARFLNCCFAAAPDESLMFETVSEQLARQIQHLLLRFGVISALRLRSIKYKDDRRPAWQLDITDACSIRNFIDEIAIFGKEAAIEAVDRAISSRQYQPNRDLVPVEVWQSIAAAKGDESWRSLATRAGLQGVSNIHVGKRALTRHRLASLATALDNLELQHLSMSDVYWDSIVSIESIGEGQVYDLTIPETHNFVANDVCVHNTSFVLNIARNIAVLHKLPVCIFSLEMSKEQLVYRLLSSEVSIESGRLRTGRIRQEEWEVLGHAISSLSQLPIFIDDTPDLTVSDMRSKLRRLQAENGGKLGLVLIDYLQLMEGTSDNRVQELSKMTRALKGMARELQVPVMTLSQLSRGVESRPNKRPMMSDLRESGCITGETLITLADSGRQVPIRELVGQSNISVWALNETTMKLERSIVSHAFSTGVKPVLKLDTALGRSIRATANHQFLTIRGWKRLDELQVGDRIALPRQLLSSTEQTLDDAKLALLGHLIGDGCTLPRHAIQYTTREMDLAETVSALATRVFGSQITPRIVPERTWYQVYLAASERLTHGVRNPVAEWMDELEVFGLRSHEKFIPAQVFEQPQSAISLFLRHLWSTDGCIKLIKGRNIVPIAYYASSSQRLATDVQSLLLRIGINARHKVIPQVGKGRDQHHVIVTGKLDLEKFVTQVGAVGAYKQSSLQDIDTHLKNTTANTNRDVIEQVVWRQYAVPAMQTAGLTTRQMQSQLGMSYRGTGIYQQNISRDRALRLATVVKSPELLTLATSDIYWDQVKSIEPDGMDEVYDLTVPGLHNFVANNIVVHNSIEQDADLVMMIYRDEYYNPDSADRGIAEIIITKHRNGPVGTVKLLFEPQFTRFRNLASS